LGEAGEDLDALEEALLASRRTDRPTLIVLRTHIAFPSPDHVDDHAAHGNPFTPQDVSRTKAKMGIPDEPFWAPSQLVDAYRLHSRTRGLDARNAWLARTGPITTTPEWNAAWTHCGTEGWNTAIPYFEPGTSMATRAAIQHALEATADCLPGLLTGSADLTGSNGTGVNGFETHTADNPGGRQLHYGIREHAMGSALVGMALHGGTLPVGGTFLVFSDYMRPALRLAALSQAGAVFVFTHDSVGVGEDGPTHQPVEHLAALRAIPGLHVIRPADANETVHAWLDAVNCDRPTALVLSRQGIPVTTDGSAVHLGAAPVNEVASPDVVLLATGSEVALCMEAADTLAGEGVAARVVSMPSWDRFASRPRAERDEVLPPGVPVLSVEAATTFGWERWADECIGIDRFGASAPAAVVMTELGISLENVVERASALAK
jgi:transketolase